MYNVLTGSNVEKVEIEGEICKIIIKLKKEQKIFKQISFYLQLVLNRILKNWT